VTKPAAVVRPPAVAGSFYPADPTRLAELVDRLLREAGGDRLEQTPVALVVPHAGYVYSGAVAAGAYSRLRGVEPAPRRIVVAGPAHFVPLEGASVPTADAWSTPLGTVAINDELRAIAVDSGAAATDWPHAPEHSIEVQIPFLQRVVGDGLSILPLAVGDVAPGRVADILAKLRDAADLLVVSTDLSHYHPDDVARRLDRQTVAAIVARDPDAIDLDAACGIFGLRGVVELARRRDLPITILDQRTSADAGGDTDRVVGYVAIAVG
jgi:hypothetical protein